MLSYPDFKEKSIVTIFCTEGQKFSFLNDNLIVKDNDDIVVLQTTCHRMLALWIVGSGTITTGLLERSKKFGFPILQLNQSFKMIGAWNAPTEGNFVLRRKQYTTDGFVIAKQLISNKLTNQILTLKSIRKKEKSCTVAIEAIKNYHSQILIANDLATLMGLEGMSAKLYFKEWFNTLDWKGRKPRVKHDPLNVLLDIGYTFLFYLVENMLHLYGFDVYQGVCHTNFYKRKSLVCDLQEPFRCIVDKAIKNAYGLGQIKVEDFEFNKGQYSLKYAKSKHYTRLLMKTILEHKGDVFLYCQQYYRAFIRGKEIEMYPVFEIKNQ